MCVCVSARVFGGFGGFDDFFPNPNDSRHRPYGNALLALLTVSAAVTVLVVLVWRQSPPPLDHPPPAAFEPCSATSR